MKNKDSVLKNFLSFYPGLLRSLCSVLLITVCSSVVAFAVVWPLWATAVNSKTVYNWLILICFLAVCITVPLKKSVNLKKTGYSTKEIIKKHFIPFLVDILFIFVLFMTVMLAVVFFVNGFISGGLITCTVILLLAGLFRSVKAKINQ